MSRAPKIIRADDGENLGSYAPLSVPSDKILTENDETLAESLVIADSSVLDKNAQAENLAFMEEKVQVRVHDSSDPQALPVVPVWSNGIAEFFPRGEIKVTRRRFVESLARAKHVHVSTPDMDKDPRDNMNRIVRRPSLKYPFEVIGDTPKGAAWLQQVLAQP